ncbi:hypothetical protein GKAS_04612 [Kluyvera ascorbata ATCC 33433]|nr:hypothetical protein [Kluyvera ascorbata]KFC88427.1 hypothetical protein GKAS_04612 [Kluyvera ascorbata ATCC 33433]MDU1198795.1 hypothetical protein [Kluyvera ascorbata]STW98023.1 Uncharacterised protein [Kluyvera ascorbata]BCA38774.1 hypothetical protein KATP_12960 [Kluyvera ascorbata]HBL0735505.1 hypothetical protein [Kluyvera ascorbata]
MLVSYNEIKHLSDIHTVYEIDADVLDRNSNTKSIQRKLGRLWDVARDADYCVCFVETDLYGPAGFTMPGSEATNDMPSLLFFIQNSCRFEDVESLWIHESIHHQQMTTGRLSIGGDGYPYWDGVRYNFQSLPDLLYTEGHPEFAEQVINVLKYYAQPWELEAQRDNWDTNNLTFRIGKSLVDKYGTCWKDDWDEEKRKVLISHHGLGYAFRDLLTRE